MFFKEAGTRATATIYTLPPFAVQFLEEGDLERKKKTRERVEERRGEEREIGRLANTCRLGWLA